MTARDKDYEFFTTGVNYNTIYGEDSEETGCCLVSAVVLGTVILLGFIGMGVFFLIKTI